MMRFFSKAIKVSSQIQSLAASESAYHSLQEFLEDAESNGESLHEGAPPLLVHHITLRDVTFAYAEGAVLSRFNGEIKANKITSVIGPSGAGKTTLLDLIAGLLEPSNGEICVDGVPMANIDTREWRNLVGYVPQEPFLLNDSVYSNVALGDPSITRDNVISALTGANAWEFVESLDGQLDFNVGERGSRLSGGQRQRVMIARALVNRPTLLIFDEATSSLDAISEREVCNTILNLRGTHTIICASHRPMLVEASDQIIKMDKLVND
jgi:ATP-binding cassette subfamily C protein